MRKIWTEEEAALVTALRRQGLTINAIAEKTGRTARSVQAWLTKHPARRRWKEWKPEDERQLMRLLEQGVTYEMAAQAMHRSKGAVRGMAWLIRTRERA